MDGSAGVALPLHREQQRLCLVIVQPPVCQPHKAIKGGGVQIRKCD